MGESKSQEAEETTQGKRRGIIFVGDRASLHLSPCLLPHLLPEKRGKDV